MQHLFFWEATRTPISTSFLNIALLDICHTNWWIFVSIIFWLVVSTHLKNTNQNGNLPQIGINIKNIWNHHLLLHQNVPKARWTLWFKNLRLNSPPLFFQSASQARGDAFVDPAGGSRWIGYDQVRLDSSGLGPSLLLPHQMNASRNPLQAGSWICQWDVMKFSAKKVGLKQRNIMRNRKPSTSHCGKRKIIKKANMSVLRRINLPFVGTSSSPANMSNSSVWDDHQSRALASARKRVEN